MEKYFGNFYKGDPGVPHTNGGEWWSIWIGSGIYGIFTYIHPYQWNISNAFNWHDRAMIFEQANWKRAMKKNKRYQFEWNQYMDKETRTSYYFNEPTYFN